MTVEEIEIIVTAKVEEALKEFQKFLPAIKQVMKQAQETFSKIDMKEFSKKVNQASVLVRKKSQEMRKSVENNNIKIRVNNDEAKKQISQVQKEIDSLQKKISEREWKLNVTNGALDKIRDEKRQEVIKEMPDAGAKRTNQFTQLKLYQDPSYVGLEKQSDKLNNEVLRYNALLDSAKVKLREMKENAHFPKITGFSGSVKDLDGIIYKVKQTRQEIEQTSTTQNKLSSFFSALKQKINQIKPSIESIKKAFAQIPSIGQNISKVTQKINNNIKGMGKGFKSNFGQILRYAGALFSLQSIYSTLSGAANTWLSSQNAGAKQLSANIDYMKYAMGSAFAPVIQYVTGLVYQLMKAIQSVVYALFKVNIFAKASASSYASMAGSAKKAKNETKSLSNIHSEINNVSDSNNSDSGNDTTSPSFDLSGIDNQMSPLSQKLYDFFKPLVDSWNKYGTQVVEAFKNAVNGIGQATTAMWSSVETLFTNGTIYSIVSNILNLIGQIGIAWANAWNNDNNGTEIIQGIANMIDDITNVILNLVSSTGFQAFLDGIISAFSGIVQFIEPIVSGFSDMAEKMLEIVLSAIGGVLESVGNTLQTISQNETAVEILKAIGGAIAIIVAAVVLWNAAQLILNGLMGLFAIITSPITLIILGIVAVITAAIIIFKNWGTISEWLGQKFTEAKEAITKAFQNIGQWFSDRWKDITNAFSNVGSWFRNKFQDAYNGIKNVFSNIGNFFSGIWNGIKNTFSALGTKIGDAISGAVKSGINGVISLIERTINSAIRLINGGIGMINLIPGVSIGTINTLSLPRLAKGNVAYDETLAIFGEYSGASNNPEITTPQNIMRDTFEDVLSDYNGNNGQPVHVTIQYLGKEIFDDTIDYINSKTRRTGKNTIVTVGD